MPIRAARFYALTVACFVLFLSAWMLGGAQANLNRLGKDEQSKAPSPATPGADYSGMYSFLRDGEFVQVSVEDQGHVIGFVSRYAGSEGDGGFLEHFFKSGKLDGNQLVFTTETVHGVSFEFRGTVERARAKVAARKGITYLRELSSRTPPTKRRKLLLTRARSR